MLSDLKKISKDLIIYSALVADFEPLDFKDDALAGVRANYFNSRCTTQNEKTELYIDDVPLNLAYSMKQDEPLVWKAAYNNRPYQTVKRSSGGIYCVLTYNSNGFIYKRMYFDFSHNWLRTEYYSDSSDKPESLLYPKRINGLLALIYEEFDPGGGKTTLKLFPSIKAPRKKSFALVYSNSGMIWYDPSFEPADIEYGEDSRSKANGFNFSPDNFNGERQSLESDLFDNADYLSDADINSNLEIFPEEPAQTEEKPYSAYDKIESILFEAHKTNKNIFGEIVSQADSGEESTAEADEPETVENQEIAVHTAENPPETVREAAESEKIEEDADDFENADAETLAAEMAEAFGESIADVSLEESGTAADKDEAADSKSGFVKAQESERDSVIKTATGEYSYYGELDGNGKRTGRGRTVTPDGKTSYEGEYSADRRHGFGICYYKEGSVNYVGNWENGNRSGSGVGYRLSDGTMHAGKWHNNSPQGFGARFDKDGGFLDVCTYVDGKRNGKSVSFDAYGNIVIKYWSDGKLVSEKIIAD